MKVTIDNDLCTGCGLCSDKCPEVYEVADDLAKVIVTDVPEAAAETCREAVTDCPVEAITIQE